MLFFVGIFFILVTIAYFAFWDGPKSFLKMLFTIRKWQNNHYSRRSVLENKLTQQALKTFDNVYVPVLDEKVYNFTEDVASKSELRYKWAETHVNILFETAVMQTTYPKAHPRLFLEYIYYSLHVDEFGKKAFNQVRLPDFPKLIQDYRAEYILSSLIRWSHENDGKYPDKIMSIVHKQARQNKLTNTPL